MVMTRPNDSTNSHSVHLQSFDPADTFREPQGMLKHPYIVPSGPYNNLWDWYMLQ